MLIATEIFAICKNKGRTIEEIAQKIYKTDNAKSVVRTYQCIMILLKHDILVPQFKGRILTFIVKNDKAEV